MNLLWNLSKAAQSFSLAVNGKTACLSTHTSQGCQPHAVGVIRTYRLDDEKDVESMAARIGSILAWAENSRLQSIRDLLFQFDGRVQLRRNTTGRKATSRDPKELAKLDVAKLEVVPKKRRSIIKSVFVESLPEWARAPSRWTGFGC